MLVTGELKVECLAPLLKHLPGRVLADDIDDQSSLS